MRGFSLLLVTLFCAAAAGCGSSDATEDASTYATPEVVAEVKADRSVPTPEDVPDLSTPDLPSFDVGPEEGDFLWPCTANTQCDSGFCVTTSDGGRCSIGCVEDCPEGWACQEADTKPDIVYVCLPRFLTLCDPCHTADDCKTPDALSVFLNQCLEFPNNTGSFCGADCDDQNECPDGYACESVQTPGGTFFQCLPENGACECSFLAMQEEKSTTCINENEFGLCEGERACTTEGLSDCSAMVPADEMCDDTDNDCDDVLDEGCDDDSDGYCDADMLTLGTPAACGSGPGDCNDGDPAIFPGASEECDSKDNNCDGLVDEGLCDDGDACTDDLCDPEAGCSHPLNAAPCDDGNSCTDNDHCFQGVCKGAEKYCDDGNPCTANLCDPVSEMGCYFVNNSDMCTDDGNQCTLDVCDNGECQHKPSTGLPCNDENPCTINDTCNSGKCMGGAPADCDDGEQCTVDSCDQLQGCVHEAVSGVPCIYTFVPIICELPGVCGATTCVPTANCQCPDCNLCLCCSGGQQCLDGLF